MKTGEIILEFLAVTNDLYGVYLDSIRGFSMILKQAEFEQVSISEKMSLPLDQVDNFTMDYSKGEDYAILHTSTIKELKTRNLPGGRNYIIAANTFISELFSYWDSHYRAHIANSIGIEVKKFELDIVGDVRLIRNAIIHNKGISTPEITKCKQVKWFKPGDKIALNEKNIWQLVELFRVELNHLAFVCTVFEANNENPDDFLNFRHKLGNSFFS